MNNNRWAVIAGAVLLAVIVGVFAYNAGVASAVQQSGKVVTAPYPYPPYPYYWHGPGFFFFPFFGIFLFFLVLRGLFWRGGWHHRGGCGSMDRLDEWHRQSHERMKGA
jgi:hypothetical protein